MLPYLLIALGGAGGALSRYGVARLGQSWLPHHYWPWGTFAVNLLGSVAIGAVYVLIAERSTLHSDWRYILIVGFLGAFTTFSTFSLESVALFEAGRPGAAISYIAATLFTCVLGCWLGMMAMR